MKKKSEDIWKRFKAEAQRHSARGAGLKGAIEATLSLKTLRDKPYAAQKEGAAFREYVVVKLVAALQIGFKEVVRQVLEFKEDAGAELPSIDEKITLDMVREFKNGKFTMGHFVSHIISVSSIQQIAAAIEAYLGTSLKRLYNGTRDQWSIINHTDLTECEGTMSAITALFNRRNMICHELNFNNPTSEEEVERWNTAVYVFLNILNEYLRYLKSKMTIVGSGSLS